MKVTRATLRRSLAVAAGLVFLASTAAMYAQVKTETSTTSGAATKQVQVLTDGPGDESPSLAPNGKLIIYASETGGRGILAAVSSDGRVKQRLVAPATDVREPAWGPLPRS